MTIIWLARHGNRQDFVDSSWRERATLPHDPPLSADGLEQARRLGERLRLEGIRFIYSSPYLRTVQTAHEVADVLDLPIRLEPGFGEHLSEAWFAEPPQRLSEAELAERFSRVVFDHAPICSPTYPESTVVAFRRAADAVRRIAARHRSPVLFIGHGSSVSGAAMLLSGDREETPCPLAALFKIVHRPSGYELELRADTSHLDCAIGGDRFF